MSRNISYTRTTSGAGVLLASVLLAVNGGWLIGGVGALFGAGLVVLGMDVPRGAGESPWSSYVTLAWVFFILLVLLAM